MDAYRTARALAPVVRAVVKELGRWGPPSFTRGGVKKRRGRKRWGGPTRHPRMARGGGLKELKNQGFLINDAIISATGDTSVSVVRIAQGITENQRLGRRILTVRFMFRGHVSLPLTALASQTADIVRIILVHDKQCNGAIPPVAGSTGVLQLATYNSWLELDNRDRFRVLFNRFYVLNSLAGGGQAGDVFGVHIKMVRGSIKLAIPIEFSGAGGLIGDIRSNNLFFIFISQGGFAGVALDTRLRFTG